MLRVIGAAQPQAQQEHHCSEEGGVKAEAVNDGIVYLMAFPYILVGIIGYVVYKSRQKKKA